jgi:integrase/recombinase XerD
MSTLEQSLADYLQLRRSLGHDLADAARLLPRFVIYLDSVGADTVTIEHAMTWAQHEAEPGTTVGPRRMTAVRGFARFLAGRDARTEIPPVGLLPYRRRWRPPFIYTPDDIAALLDQTHRSLPQPALRAVTYHTLVGLLAVTGLRIGEAIRLDRADVDWPDGVLLIRESKFGKSRQVPVHASTLNALAVYATQRDQLQPTLQPSFFVSSRRTRLCYQVVCQTFRTLVDAANIGTESTATPTLHGLRHSFAVRTLLEWYRTGQDVDARLPWLSTYLGHRDPRSTYWYLSATPELLAMAADRLQAATTRVVTP